MIEKINKLSEKLATSVGESRRGFLGHVGQAALVTFGVLTGIMAFPSKGYCAINCGYASGQQRYCDDYDRQGRPLNCCVLRGVWGGCCPNGALHTCASSAYCYPTYNAAVAACGSDPVMVCGRG